MVASIARWVVRPLRPVALPPLDRHSDTVILVTFDGVRPRELLHGRDPALDPDGARAPVMPYLMNEMVPHGTFLGSDGNPPGFRVGSPVAVSMSGYHSIFAGRLTFCVRNETGPPRGSTLITRIQDAYAGHPAPVAMFSTWPPICDSVKADESRALLCRGAGAARRLLANRGVSPRPGDGRDAATVDAALHLLRTAPPPFLHVGLDESDSSGHSGDYLRHVGVLERYDGFLREIVAAAGRLRSTGRTATLIVTTDHGRGRGAEWVEHRWNIAGSDAAWIFAMGHGIRAQGRCRTGPARSQYDIRPTIEYLMGILPRGRRWWQGAVMSELLERPRKSGASWPVPGEIAPVAAE